jgi:hypothetical protein
VQVSAFRLALMTGAATAAAFGLFYLWLRSPLALALLGAALFGTVFMMVAASLGDDPVAADEAWRLEAGDPGGEESAVSIRAGRDGRSRAGAVRPPTGPRSHSESDGSG